ncbi:MAG: hypothetical protein UY81_C0072G0009 [Candidatus Giovannonibacteria bacterium GW2011_GWA2_53_7]|uniref:Uncharacterized protein n=1 Tax=Candidatus Giovannonibacteria bacterium GW2011_GWA2_53_7 TaxID=1618650 RepID=A0A0G1XTG1_9BACT|nr:MAG: hypothetical protein UY81_C0072G0009 [Candidatus Giovannonibacteria bacterium GW2011_GWA2_53_7]
MSRAANVEYLRIVCFKVPFVAYLCNHKEANVPLAIPRLHDVSCNATLEIPLSDDRGIVEFLNCTVYSSLACPPKLSFATS